jgi:hypothetical protein
VRRLVRLYPPAWRRRYGDELEALLEQTRPTPAAMLNVVLGAAEVRWQACAPVLVAVPAFAGTTVGWAVAGAVAAFVGQVGALLAIWMGLATFGSRPVAHVSLAGVPFWQVNDGMFGVGLGNGAFLLAAAVGVSSGLVLGAARARRAFRRHRERVARWTFRAPALGEPAAAAAPAAVEEWRWSRAQVVWWSLVAVQVTGLGLLVFTVPVVLRAVLEGRGGITLAFGVTDALVALALCAVLVGAHEMVHGAVMRLFGARPRFGVALLARVAPVVYATAPGHRFTRDQYLAVTVAPGLLISVLGLLACGLTPFGGYLFFPLAVHLGGCAGDAAALLKLLPERSTAGVEDLRDGLRIHRAAQAEGGGRGQ